MKECLCIGHEHYCCLISVVSCWLVPFQLDHGDHDYNIMYGKNETAEFLFMIAIIAIDACCCLGWSQNETSGVTTNYFPGQ